MKNVGIDNAARADAADVGEAGVVDTTISWFGFTEAVKGFEGSILASAGRLNEVVTKAKPCHDH